MTGVPQLFRGIGLGGAAMLLSCAAPAERQIAKSAGCPEDASLATLVAESDIILLAEPQVPVAQYQAALKQPSPDYIDVPLANPEFMKGSTGANKAVLKVNPEKNDYSPLPETVESLSRRRAIMFLAQVDQGPVGLYFQHSPTALQEALPDTQRALNSELQRQQAHLENWTIDASLPHFKEVRGLLASLEGASEEEQRQIFSRLEGLGTAGVPAIIALMDDRRPLAHQQISLVNHDPSAFEGIRHYGPELVVDALDAILNQITGFGGFVTNGGSERQRRHAVAAWRIYASDLNCQRKPIP